VKGLLTIRLYCKSTETTRNPFEEDGKKKTGEQIAKGKGENEAECADCDAFRSGAALTIPLLPISTSRSTRSFACFCSSLILSPGRRPLLKKNWQEKAGNGLFPNVDQENFFEKSADKVCQITMQYDIRYPHFFLAKREMKTSDIRCRA